MQPEKDSSRIDSPPLFSRWKYWYILLIGNLIFLIILFQLFSLIYL